MGGRNSGHSVASSGLWILGVMHVHRIDVDIIIFSWATLGISLWVIDLLWAIPLLDFVAKFISPN